MPKSHNTCTDGTKAWFDTTFKRMQVVTNTSTQDDLAKILGCQQSSISDAKKRCSIPAEWLVKLYKSYGVNPDFITDGTAPVYIDETKALLLSDMVLRKTKKNPSAKSHPRIIQVSTLVGATTAEDTWRPSPFEELAVPEAYAGEHIQVVKVQSEEMSPTITKNSYVGINTKPQEIPDGALYAIHFKHQGLIIRRSFLTINGYSLRADNKDFPPITIPAEAMVSQRLGRVAWILQDI